MTFPLFPAALLLACCGIVLADGPAFTTPSLKLEKNGSFQMDGAAFSVSHYGKAWDRAAQAGLRQEPGFPQDQSSAWSARGSFPVPGADSSFSFREHLEKSADGGVHASYRMESPSPVPSNGIYLEISLPVAQVAGRQIVIDGVPHVLPSEFSAVGLIDVAKASSLLVPSEGGAISIHGAFSVHVQDNRQWTEFYVVRIGFAVSSKSPFQAELAADIQPHPYRSTPISMEAQCNRGFRDDVANDGKGGWTDQGPQNDLSMIVPGPLKAANVDFEIVDPAKNRGSSCLVFAPGNGKAAPLSAVIPVPGQPSFANLYLLHATAWTPPAGTEVGTIVVRYQDGGEKVFPVVAGRDAGDWWSPQPLANARIGWTSENAGGPIGLHVSRFQLDGKPVREIEARGAGKGLWMIAGISGSPDDIQSSVSVPSVIAAGAEWAPCDVSLAVAPGGAFDFSSLNEAPAGKDGHVVVTPDGHFAFQNRPERKVRFWGVNLCFGAANGLSHKEADDLADRLARSGYNAVRLHHFDRELRDPNGFSYDLVPDRLERMDYLVQALKLRGIYINIDLYTARRFKPEELAGFSFGYDVSSADSPNWFKGAVVVSDAAFASWKKFAENLLTHKNPYTGTTWAQEPALIGICTVNEDTLSNTLRHDPRLGTIYEGLFEKWRAQPENSPGKGESQGALYNRFLMESQMASEARMAGFLKSLGVQAPVTGVNYMDTLAQTYLRERFDYVDNHVYADHPAFPDGQAWTSAPHFRQESSTRSGARVPRAIMTSRVFGKPYAITEYDSVSVNAFRAEGGVAMPAYASLQDWDAVYHFDYASDQASAAASGSFRFFDLTSDPINLLADRVSALLFRRGDIDPAKGAIRFHVDRQAAFGGMKGQWADFPFDFSFLGLITRIGSGTLPPPASAKFDAEVTDAASAPAPEGGKTYRADPGLVARLLQDGILPGGAADASGKRFTSDTGQLELSMADGTLKAVGPRSESFVLPPGGELRGSLVSVKNGSSFGTVQVAAIDNKPLGQSGRILVLHLTDSLYTGMKFQDRDRRVLEGVGALPHLVRRGSAAVSLSLDPKGTWKAWALDVTGARQEEAALRPEAAGFVLDAETAANGHARLAYEIVRQNP